MEVVHALIDSWDGCESGNDSAASACAIDWEYRSKFTHACIAHRTKLMHALSQNISKHSTFSILIKFIFCIFWQNSFCIFRAHHANAAHFWHIISFDVIFLKIYCIFCCVLLDTFVIFLISFCRGCLHILHFCICTRSPKQYTCINWDFNKASVRVYASEKGACGYMPDHPWKRGQIHCAKNRVVHSRPWWMLSWYADFLCICWRF